MRAKTIKSVFQPLLMIGLALIISGCFDKAKKSNSEESKDNDKDITIYPSDVIPFMDEWKILLGDGTRSEDLVNYAKERFLLC